MYQKLTDQVWFGNWDAPFETLGQVQSILNVAHTFSERRGRNRYWAFLGKLDYNVLYQRLAKKDREDATPEYLAAVACFADTAQFLGKLPILCHCQMGGHRGPSSALFVAWHLGGRKEFNLLHHRALELCPGLARGRNYYRSVVAYCEKWEITPYPKGYQVTAHSL